MTGLARSRSSSIVLLVLRTTQLQERVSQRESQHRSSACRAVHRKVLGVECFVHLPRHNNSQNSCKFSPSPGNLHERPIIATEPSMLSENRKELYA